MARWMSVLVVAAVLGSSACEKPAPPKVVPKGARVAAITPAGLDVVVKIEATNPNSVTLSAQSFTGKAKLDGKWDLSPVTIAKPVVLPPHQPTTIEVPLTMPWRDLSVLAALSTVKRPVPYVLDCSVRIGGESLNVDVPFSVTGTITREQIAAAAGKTIPGFLPPRP